MEENIIQTDTAGEAAENMKSAETRPAQKENHGAVFFEAASVIVTAMAMIAVIFTFFFRIVGVNGSSMDNTLHNGDWLIVTPYYKEPVYGDIVISTKDTAAEGALVKRVIAVAGDEVVVDEYDNVFVNGVEINDDPYIETDGQNWRHGDLEYPVTVPEGCVMLMGDHRSVSWDSRYKDIGFAEVDYLLGKAQLRVGKSPDIYANFPG